MSVVSTTTVPDDLGESPFLLVTSHLLGDISSSIRERLSLDHNVSGSTIDASVHLPHHVEELGRVRGLKDEHPRLDLPEAESLCQRPLVRFLRTFRMPTRGQFVGHGCLPSAIELVDQLDHLVLLVQIRPRGLDQVDIDRSYRPLDLEVASHLRVPTLELAHGEPVL